MYYETQENWVPSFIRGGNVVTRQDRVRSSTVTKYGDPYTFIVALDENEEATGSLYIDDTKSHSYQQGEFLNAEIKLKEQKLQYEVTNSLQVDNTIEKIVFVGIKKSPEHVLIETRNGITPADFIVEDNVLVVKLADVPVNQDWVLTIN